MKGNKFVMVLLVLAALISFSYYHNNFISITKVNVISKKIPQSFNGFKVVHLSDLHNKMFGKNQSNLIKLINKAKPDIIVITGDLVDSRRYNEEKSMILINKLVGSYPVYYVTGNHEWRSGKYSSLEEKLNKAGVKILKDIYTNIIKNNEKIVISGVDDPSKYNYDDKYSSSFKNSLNAALKDTSIRDFRILLSHRPERLSQYQSSKIDLALSGHAHGGQVRIPFIGGIVAPHQGFFPKYTSGAYTENGTTMIVSRGLGNSIAPQRVFNRPEIVVVTLTNE
jgi:uncharacterized protein